MEGLFTLLEHQEIYKALKPLLKLQNGHDKTCGKCQENLMPFLKNKSFDSGIEKSFVIVMINKYFL